MKMIRTLLAVAAFLAPGLAHAQTFEQFNTYVLGLPAASTVNPNDVFYLNQGGVSKAVTGAVLSATATLPSVGPGQILGNYTSGNAQPTASNWMAAANGCPASSLSTYQLNMNAAAAPTNTLLTIFDGTQCVSIGTLNSISHKFIYPTGFPLNVLDPPYNVDNTGSADAQPGIQQALNDAAAAPAGTYCVYIPAGKYKLSGGLLMNSAGACIYGDGPNATTLSVVGNNPVIVATEIAPWMTISNLTVQNNGTPANGSVGIEVAIGNGGVQISNVVATNNYVGFLLGATGRSVCFNCNSTNNLSDGYQFVNSISVSSMQWMLLQSNAFQNGGWGVNVVSSVTGNIVGPYLIGFGESQDTAGCIQFGGTSGVLYTDLQMSQVTCSGPGGGGGLVIAPGPRVAISGLYVESTGQFVTGPGGGTAPAGTGAGVKFIGTGSADAEVTMNNITVWGNSDQGFYFPSGPSVARVFMTDVHAYHNGLATNNPVGIDLENTSTIYTITASDSWNPTGESPASQNYGLKAARGGNVYLAQNNFNGNATSGCTFTDAVVPTGSSLGAGCVGNAPNFINVPAQSFSATNTGVGPFTSPAAPLYFWANPTAGLNAKGWYAYVGTTGTWHLCASDDAFSTCTDAISITRSGTTPGAINAATGFQVAGAAASGNVLRGNGTNFISAQLGVSDLSGLGTGVAAALADNTNATGGFPTVPVAGAQGGTGLTTAAVGDIIYASATTPTWARLADVATGSVLVSGGVNTAPTWSSGTPVTINGTGVGVGGAPNTLFGVLGNTNGGIVSQIFNANAGVSTNAALQVAIGGSNTAMQLVVSNNSANPTASFTAGAGISGGLSFINQSTTSSIFFQANAAVPASMWPSGGVTIGGFADPGTNALGVVGGTTLGTPTGGNKGAGTLNVASTIWTNGTQGLASKVCTINTANAATGITITIINGLITATTTC